MTYQYFPLPLERQAATVRAFRSALEFVEYCIQQATYPCCTKLELIGRRASAMMSLFQAMRKLNALICHRMSADDLHLQDSIFEKAIALLEKYEKEYFCCPISSLMPDEEIISAWQQSQKYKQLEHLRNPAQYPLEYSEICLELGIQ